MNGLRSSPSCNLILMENCINTSLSIYLLITTRLLPITWNYNRCRSIISLYYSLRTTINLNSITADQPRFEPKSPGPKAAKLPLWYTPLTRKTIFACFVSQWLKKARTKLTFCCCYWSDSNSIFFWIIFQNCNIYKRCKKVVQTLKSLKTMTGEWGNQI